MSNWNTGPGYGGYPPPPDPNQGYYGGQPPMGGYPPQQPYPGMPQQGGYPPPGMAGGYPPQSGMGGGYPPQPGFQGGPQGFQQGGPQGFQQGGYPPAGQGSDFVIPPPYIHNPGGGDPSFNQPRDQGKHENTPLSSYAQHGMYGSGYQDDVEGEVKGFDFDDRTIRHGFIRKVYAILMVQLSITLAFIATFLYHEPTRRFMHSHIYLFYISLVTVFVCLIVLACCGEVRRKAPYNFIFLGIFTLAESLVLGVSASVYDSEAVLMAVGLTTAVCLGLTLFAFQTKWDFTIMGGALFVAAIILMLFGIVAIFIKGKIITLVYASIGALIFSLYLIYDTQLMMGGKHKYSISPEEYIFAALNLYLDIVNIFIYILTIIGASRD